MDRKEIDDLAKLIRDATGRKMIIYDPGSMTQAELKETENTISKEQEKAKNLELGIEQCSKCYTVLETGSSICKECGGINQ